MATFVYCVLVLVSIGPGDRGDFIPHLSITTTFCLVLVSMAVLIYFIHHITSQIQLPQVIAGIAKDLAHAVEVQSADNPHSARVAPDDAPSPDELIAMIDNYGSVVRTPESGYLQFIRHRTLVRIAGQVDAVIRLPYRPGHFLVEDESWRLCGHPKRRTRPGDRTSPDAYPGYGLRRRSDRRDRHPGIVTRRQ